MDKKKREGRIPLSICQIFHFVVGDYPKLFLYSACNSAHFSRPENGQQHLKIRDRKKKRGTYPSLNMSDLSLCCWGLPKT
jgi:hypothetical protein